jgi:hypothetical protein
MKRGAPLLFVLAACAAPNEPAEAERAARTEHTGTSASAIIRGTDSPASQDAVVLVMHYDAIKVGGDPAGCSGTLLAPRLVLTARHCVADTDESVLCDANGNATVGGKVSGDNDPTKLFAFAGQMRPDFISGLDTASRGMEVIDDGAMTLCNHDLALILLATPLQGGKTAPIRLDGGPQKGENVTLVGWGVTDKSDTPQTRQQRTGLSIAIVGPADHLGPFEFSMGESGCAGDSGGPALDAASGAVVGILSRGGNTSGAQAGTLAACTDAENILTAVSGFGDVIRSAYAKAGQDPWLEGQPDPATLPPKAADDGSSGGCAVTSVTRASRGGNPRGPAGAFAAFVLSVIAACARRRRSRS